MEALNTQHAVTDNPAELITNNLDIWTSAIQTRSSSGRGSSKKLNLYGIKKLRKLILELAVRGNLVPQDPNDEPASVLLKQIAAEKAQLVKDKKIKKPKPLPKIYEDEKPFELPLGWESIRLGNTGYWATGNGFPKKEQGHEDLDILFCKVSDMNLGGNERFIRCTANTVTLEAAARLKLNLHPVGTVIFPKIGGAIATNKRRLICKPTAIDNNCLGISPNAAVNPDYLFLLLTSIDMAEYQAGTSVPALSQGTLELLPVGLPPQLEQHRIVAKVDELMALCDQLEQQTEASIEARATLVGTLLATLTNSANAAELEQNWTRLADHFDTLFTTEHSIDQLKQTVLQLAVMGKLVPQDPNDEPAAVLLEKIAAEKAQLIKEKKIKKQKPLPPITEEEKPFPLPDGWEWCRLGEILQQISDYHANGSYKILKENVTLLEEEDYAIMLRTTNFHASNYHNYKYVDEKAYHFLSKSKLYPGDIIMNKIGDPGASFFVEDRGKPMSLAMNLFLLRCQTVNSLFVQRYLHNNYEYVRSFAAGTSTKTITKDAVNNLVFPLCSIKEQERINATTDQFITLCDQLKARLQQAQQTQLHLTDALVEQAVL